MKEFEVKITNATPGQIEGTIGLVGSGVEWTTLAAAGFREDMCLDDIEDKFDDEERYPNGVELFISGRFSHSEFVSFFDWDPSKGDLGIDPTVEGFHYLIEDNIATIQTSNARHGAFEIFTGQMA